MKTSCRGNEPPDGNRASRCRKFGLTFLRSIATVLHVQASQSHCSICTPSFCEIQPGPSTLIVSTPELRVRVHMNCRQSDFKPDPVCAFNSAREDFAVDCGYVMGWDVILFVDGFVDT